MNYTEKIYLDKISPYLTNFSQKTESLYNCSCLYCNDSRTNSRKARGYFFEGTDNNVVYSCRNCTISVPLGAFLKDNFPQYYTQYRLDMYSKKDVKLVQTPKKIAVDSRLVQFRNNQKVINLTYKSIIELPDTHPAKQYMIGRQIQDMSEFGYVDDFKQYVSEMTNNDVRYEKLPKDARIIIPLKLPDGRLVGFQGRAIGKSDLRYITIKIPDMEDEYVKIFGLNNFNKDRAGFAVEGCFDSQFLPNCIAMCGTSLDMQSIKRDYINPKNTIVIIDNEARNKQIVARMLQYVKDGFRVYVPPTSLNNLHKDINLMVLSGWTTPQLVELFVKNSFTSARAILQINLWKKC